MKKRALLLVAIPWLAAAAIAQEVSRHSVPQNAPCEDQPTSLNQLAEAFLGGQAPTASQVTGAWVAIGFVGESSRSFNCSGVTRGQTFEWVMIGNRYSVELDMIGADLQRTTLTPDNQGSLALAVDFHGDTTPVYRCRLTKRETLACLFGRTEWAMGVEFKKMPVKGDQRANRGK